MKVKSWAAEAPKQPLVPFEYETGPLGANEVDVAVEFCGICHSDLAMIDNDWGSTRYPLVPGHEIVGTVVAIGSNVDSLAVGQKVGVGWFSGSCQHCEWCKIGRDSLCLQGQGTIVGRHGGWASHVRTHWKFAVPLPEQLALDSAGPLMCAGSTVFTPMVQFGVTPRMRTAVLGIGGLGHLAVQFLAKFGCEVTAISSTHAKDEEGRGFGATNFISSKSEDELKRAASSFDFILSTISVSVNWVDYINALRPTGQLVLVGVPDSDLRFPFFPLIAEKSVRGGCSGSPSDTSEMLRFAARHGVKPMIELFRMQEMNRACDHLRAGKARYRVVLKV
jgi:uncharacterized zinc-type alcohol dehydrogenase-like protein